VRTESGIRLDTLAKRIAKVSDIYVEERSKMNRAIELACGQVEDEELELVKLRHQLAADDVAEAQSVEAAHLDREHARQEAHFLHEEMKLKEEICAMMQDLTEHKVAITEQLQSMLDNANRVKADIAATKLVATPARNKLR
jgi:hypothetical protein